MNDSHGSHPRTHYTTGQAIVIIAMGFVILLGFTGLVVDVARVFTARAQLRRAVDAAGLAAAAQFRLHATQADINNAATELMYAHDIVSDTNTFSGMAVTSLTVQTCDTDPGDTSLCTTPLRRKLVRVTAEANVSMLFLQLLGIPTVSIAAESLSEAAAVDVVLVIDSSESQAYDAPSMQAYNGRSDLSCDPTSFGVIGQDYGLNVNACTLACNDDPSHPCYPFQQVKDAAKDFIDNLYEPYDRVAVVSFDREPHVIVDLTTTLSYAKSQIDAMRVYDHWPRADQNPGDPCPYITAGGERWKCTSSNVGGALATAGDQFRTLPFRSDSLWTVILLGSGGADATDQIASLDPDSAQFGFCPGKDNLPFCRDNQFTTHHITTSVQYDAEDYAYDKANFLGCRPREFSDPGLGTGACASLSGGGMGVLVFTIGLGQKVVCTTGAYNKTTGECAPGSWAPQYEDQDTHLPNGAELFLRYLAVLGDDGDPTTLGSPACPAPTDSPYSSGTQCGDYYFAPNASGLQRIFLTIAGKIFTRLSG